VIGVVWVGDESVSVVEFMSSRKVAAIAVAVIVLGIAGPALATIVASGGSVIHACAKRGTGELRLAQNCKSNERRLSWNTQGRAAQTDSSAGLAYVTASHSLSPTRSRGVTAMTRSSDRDYYCFDLTFAPETIVVSAGLGGSYIVGDVVGSDALSRADASALCGTTTVDAVVYFPSGGSGFYATFD
jgi:hypothetical protein